MHGEGLAVAVAVAEVADAAWAALERRHDETEGVVAKEKELVEVEEALEQQKDENRRLRARLEQYQKTIESMQEQSEQENTSEVGSPSESGWNADPPELYARLIKKVESPEFLSRLTDADETPKSPEHMRVNIADDPSSWLMVTDKDLTEKELKIEHDELGQDGYVIITQEDIVDGIASFMARFISSIPQSKAMTPQELQKAIIQAFTDLERKGRLRKLWSCGKFMYSAASWGATAVGLYKNPVIVRAASMALWTSCCIVLRLLV
ncbi:hypothetical protein R1sor_010827 [Riccia sorocarpa]|uniref:Uncharacterized protein n=1 Tax=Riccia sorocarpa TaxID=122646 RepID=A0ABD3I0K7_9MARC